MRRDSHLRSLGATADESVWIIYLDGPPAPIVVDTNNSKIYLTSVLASVALVVQRTDANGTKISGYLFSQLRFKSSFYCGPSTTVS